MGSYFTHLQAGPLELEFDSRLGSIRYIKCQGHELLRGIYAVVRDGNWKTIPTALTLKKLERGGKNFSIEFHCHCELGPILYEWNGTITGDEAGRIDFGFHGQALSDFQRNRIGFCVLHPLVEKGGDVCFETRNAAGNWVAGAFPAWNSISPHQPVVDITGLSWQPASGCRAQLEFSGDLFEMEDQRNWGDASFKTYCTPQSRPKPVPVRIGDIVEQRITLTISLPRGGLAPVEATTLSNRARPLAIGLAFPSDLPMPAAAFARLGELNLHHLRVDVRPGEAGWQLKFCEAAAIASQLNVPLMPALYLTDAFAEELAAIREAAKDMKVVTWIALKDRTGRIPNAMADRAVEILADMAPVAAGTDTQFVEINRDRPSADAQWMPAFSFHPQSHLNDEETIWENQTGPIYQLATLAQFTSQPAVLSPISVRARFASRVFTPLPVDPRQEEKFGAEWLRGVLSSLQLAANLHCVTLFPTHGPGAILDASGNPRPAWTMLQDSGFARRSSAS